MTFLIALSLQEVPFLLFLDNILGLMMKMEKLGLVGARLSKLGLVLEVERAKARAQRPGPKTWARIK